jgi:hypothetical protein
MHATMCMGSQFHGSTWFVVGAAVVVSLAVQVDIRAADPDDSGPRKAFRDAVARYVDVRERAETIVPKLKETYSPEDLSKRERQLGETVQRLRSGAKEGDVFAPARTVIRQIVRHEWRQRTAAERREIMRELPGKLRPRANTLYPTTYPLLSFPPSMLRDLPKLPDAMEYRLVGPHLILRDSKANLIVDVLPNVINLPPAQGGPS